MPEGWNNETVLHENRSYFPGERKCIVFALQHGGNDVTWKRSAAMLEGWNNETVLHENRSYFPGKRKYCFSPPTWRQWRQMRMLYRKLCLPSSFSLSFLVLCMLGKFPWACNDQVQRTQDQSQSGSLESSDELCTCQISSLLEVKYGHSLCFYMGLLLYQPMEKYNKKHKILYNVIKLAV